MKKAILLILVILTVFCMSAQAQKARIIKGQPQKHLSLDDAKLKYHQANLLQNSPLETDNPLGIVFEEHFDGQDIPADWTALAQGWDYIYVYDSVLNFFKQSEGDDPMILSTPSIDLSTVSKMEFDMASFPQNTGIAVIQVGTMSDPNDASTFQLIDEFIPLLYEWHTFSIVLKAFTNTTHLAFKLIGLPWDYVSFDNVIMYNDIVIDKSPFYVSNLQVVTGNTGEMAAHFTWTNPTKQKDGFDLETLDSIQIVSAGTVVHTVYNPVIGGQQDVTFDVPAAGFYRFNVIPYNTYGKGFIAQAPQVWVGQDQPGAPTNTVLVKSGNTANLSWSPPVSGAHGYYFDGTVDQYEITRADGVKFYVPGKDTTFSEDITIPGTFNYSIAPYNSSGKGLTAVSNAAQYLMNGYLVYEDFWVDPVIEGFWSSTETNWQQWQTNYAGGDAGELAFSYYPDFQGQSRVLSPVINTTGMSTLALEFRKYCALWTTTPYKLKIETTSDGGNTWNIVYSWDVTENQPAEYIMKAIHTADVGSPNFQFAFTFEGNASDIDALTIDDVRLYSSTAINLAYVSNNLPPMAEPQKIVTPKVKVENIGSEITPYEATFTLTKGTEEVYKSVKSGQVQIGVTDSITFDNWTTLDGEYKASVRIKCTGDADTLNNSADFEMNVYALMNREMVLMEEGTGTWCTYCPGAAMGIDDLITQGYKVAAIAYHSGDDYSTTEGRARLDAYNVTGFPTVYIDGPERTLVGGDHNVSLVNWYKPEVESRMTAKTPLKLEFSGLKYNNENRTLTGNIYITSLSSISNQRLRIFQVITESDIDKTWQGQTKLNFVERVMSPSLDGLPLELSSKEDLIPVNIALDAAWNATNCELIVFIQDTLTKEVYSSNMITMDNANSIAENQWGALINIFPNPAKELCIVALTISDPQQLIMKLYDPTGKLIRIVNDSYLMKGSHEIKIDLSDQPSGLYMLTFNNGKSITTKKIFHNNN